MAARGCAFVAHRDRAVPCSPLPDHRPDGSLSRRARDPVGRRSCRSSAWYCRRCGRGGLKAFTELTAGLPSRGAFPRPSVRADRRTSGGNPRGDVGHDLVGFLLLPGRCCRLQIPRTLSSSRDPTFHQNGVYAISARCRPFCGLHEPMQGGAAFDGLARSSRFFARYDSVVQASNVSSWPSWPCGCDRSGGWCPTNGVRARLSCDSIIGGTRIMPADALTTYNQWPNRRAR